MDFDLIRTLFYPSLQNWNQFGRRSQNLGQPISLMGQLLITLRFYKTGAHLHDTCKHLHFWWFLHSVLEKAFRVKTKFIKKMIDK